MPQPKEIVFRRICMLGNKNPYPSLTAFLDQESRAIFKENQFTFDEVEKYFDPSLYEKIRAGNFDTVVINLEEKYALRVASFIPTLFPVDDPFLRKIVTVIENPLIDELLNSDAKKHNTILSRRLCAKYLTQILFQKNLVRVINELCAPEGYELNLLEVGKDITKDKLHSKDELRALLLSSDIIYLGFFDFENKLCFDSDELSRAKTLVVLANGEF